MNDVAPIWLVADACGDPSRVPEAVCGAMASAARVEVATGASPALALWGRPECVVRVGPDDPPPAPGSVRVAPAPPPPAQQAHWQVFTLDLDATTVEQSLRDATVVLTRPWPDILAGAPGYAVRGATVLPWPLSMHVPPPDPKALERATEAVAAGGYAAIGVTSARAAEALTEALRQRGEKAAGQRPFLVAIGQATAAALVTGGLAPDLVAEGGGERLGTALGEHAAGGRVLLVAAAAGRTEAEDAARALGAEVDVVAAYGMADPPWRPVFDTWVVEGVRGHAESGVYVTWFSPRGVERGLRALGDLLRETAWVAVGEVTAEAARALGEPRGGIEVAESASAQAVREAVVRLHRARRRRRPEPGR